MTHTIDPRAAYAVARQTLVDEIREHGHAVTGSWVGKQVLVLNTTGAKSGELRSSPLAYSRDGDRYVIVASKGGAPSHPDWFRNLVANPEATIELDRRRIKVRASVADEPERARLYAQHEALHTMFRDYPSKTTRVIPVVTLAPVD